MTEIDFILDLNLSFLDPRSPGLDPGLTGAPGDCVAGARAVCTPGTVLLYIFIVYFILTRTRACDSPAPFFGGAECEGEAQFKGGRKQL